MRNEREIIIRQQNPERGNKDDKDINYVASVMKMLLK